MSALLTCSTIALPIDTVPAIKITHFNGVPKADQVYAYGRLYALNGNLCFSLTRFEQMPENTVRMGIVISNIDDTSRFLFLSLAFNGECSMSLYENGNPIKQITQKPPKLSSGGDEQGWYFSAQGEINASTLLDTVNVILQPKNVFLCNIYSYDISEGAFGAAFKTPDLNSIPTNKGVEPIVCVSY